MTQLTLPFEEPQINTEDFIVASSNIASYRYVSGITIFPEGRLLLLGPPSSGKTTLAQIYAKRTNAAFWREGCLSTISEHSALVIEDIEYFTDEELLFHLLNYTKEEAIEVLLTASIMPSFKLPDLASRINSIQKVIIQKPDDSLLKAVLIQQFKIKQLKVKAEVYEYIMSRAARNFPYIIALVTFLDKLSLQERRNITIPLVHEVLTKYLPANAAEET